MLQMAANALEEKINKIRQQNEEIRRRHEVRTGNFVSFIAHNAAIMGFVIWEGLVVHSDYLL